jgi:hypothetical protein
MLFSYIDIVTISERDYKIDLYLASKEKLTLSGLGYQYEDFLRELFKFRNELLLKYMLMEETLVQAGFEAQFKWLDTKGQTTQTGNCEIRLYETALVVLPQKSDPIRFPYCYLSQTSKMDYRLLLTNEFGEKLELSMLGEKFDALASGLSNAFNKMILRSQVTIKELVPEANPAVVQKLAILMKDGRAAKRKDIEQLSPNLWHRLVKKIEEAGLAKEYGFLENKALKEQMHLGVKRGLMDDLTGSYVWLLIPMVNSEGKLSNAVALEAITIYKSNTEKTETPPENTENEENAEEQDTSETETYAGGKATYFFKILGRSDFVKTNAEEVAVQFDDFMKNINRCLMDINFRREPIYLSEDKLDRPKYVQYRYSVAKLPSLKTLRSQFIGRVIHSSLDQWKSAIDSLLDFNANNKDDSAKWKKGVE